MAEPPRLADLDDLVDQDTWEYLATQQAGRPVRDSARFLLRVAQAFHAYGYSAERLEELLDHLSRSLALPAQFFTAHTGLLVSFGHQERQRTFLLRVSPGEQDLGKLVDLEAVVGRVLQGTMTPDEGTETIDRILAAPSPYGPVATVAAYGVCTAAASRMLGGGLTEIAVASVIGLLVGVLGQATSSSRRLGRLFEPMAAFLAALVASAAAVTWGNVSVYIATLSGLIIILPGLTLTLALAELSSRHLVSGTARLSGAFMVFLALAFGVALATKLVSLVASIPRHDPVGLPDWTVVAALVVIALGFTVLLRAHLRDTPWILLAGALGFGASRIGAVTLGPELATFLGALTVGMASNLYGRVLHRPEAVTLIPGILLLVPGSIGFRSLSWLIEREVVIGVENAFLMILLAAGLVAGLLVANVVIPPRR